MTILKPLTLYGERTVVQEIKKAIHVKYLILFLICKKNIKHFVASEGKLSNFFVSNVGVRQGENLSPLLLAVPLEVVEMLILKMYSNNLCCSIPMTH